MPNLVYIGWCIFWAYANHRAIDYANEHILHFINGMCHFAICIYFAIAIHWTVGVAMIFEGRLFFDVALNLFRKYGINYVSANPKSVFDQAEKFVFGKDGITPKIIYLIVSIVLTVVQFKLHIY